MSEALHMKTTGGLRLLPGIDLTASSLPGWLAGKMSQSSLSQRRCGTVGWPRRSRSGWR